MKLLLCVFVCISVGLFSSCSEDNYINTIPQSSTALVSIDAQRISGEDGLKEKFCDLLNIDDIKDCGIDFSSKLYIYETPDGNFGLSAKVSDESNVNDWLNSLSSKGYCTKPSKNKDYRFSVIKGSWVVGFSSEAFVVIGPLLPAQHLEAQRQISKYLGQDEAESIKASPIFEKLDSLDSPITIVAQSSALPEKFVAPLTLGTPKGADASQIMIAAEMKPSSDGCMEISGETFSFDKATDAQIKSNIKVFRPIQGKYLASMPSDAFAGMFMNVDGKKFIELLHANTPLQMLLTGINTAVDMDNIIKSVDGDISIVVPSVPGEDGLPLQMGAQLGNKDFLGDVEYWKQSCPKGARIKDYGPDTYCYLDGNMSYYFGVSKDMQYFSGTNEDIARRSISSAPHPIRKSVMEKIKGQRLCVVINVKTLSREWGEYGSIIEPLLGKVNTILYSIK